MKNEDLCKTLEIEIDPGKIEQMKRLIEHHTNMQDQHTQDRERYHNWKHHRCAAYLHAIVVEMVRDGNMYDALFFAVAADSLSQYIELNELT